MKPLIVFATLFLASTCSASLYGAISSQYHNQDHAGSYSYGYADPNSQKHEVRTHDGTTKGSYSYVDGYGHVQSVSYVADPHSGFHATGTNIPQGPAALHVPVAPLAYAAYAAPYAHHVPLTPHGVPVDTPEVQHAKAAHFAAHAAARSGHHHLYKRSLWGGHGYAAHHVPVIHNGVPVETPEVQHAKAAHFAAHAKALAQAGPIASAGGHDGGAYHGSAYHGPAYHGPIHIPVIHNGVPVDTPEVQHARAAHLSALSEASSRGHGGADYYGGAGQYAAGHHGPIHIPVIHNGVPVDTPEVQHAKAAHLAALAEANSRSYGHGHYDDGSYAHGHGW